jgi:hypothetical protein
MRKLIVLTLAALGLLLVASAAPALASPKTFSVHPSGGDDTRAIQAAFNAAVAAGPGSVVQLGAGQFYTNTIFVQNFRGCFRGAGKGKTLIDTLQGLGSGQPVVTVMPGVEPFPFLFGFSRGRVRVSAMTCNITATSPAAPWVDDGNATTALDTVFLVTGNASSAFRCVAFPADAGDEYGFNVAADITVQGWTQFNSSGQPIVLKPTGGRHSVSRCRFAGDEGVVAAGLTNGNLVVGGSPRGQNVFDMVGYGCVLFDNSHSQIRVSDNQMQSSQGENVLLWQGWVAGFGGALPALPAPHYLVTHNHILASGAAGGVWVEDDSPLLSKANRLRAVIAGNRFDLQNDGADAGIDGFFARGVWVVHNRFSGIGLAAVTLDAASYFSWMPSAPTSGWKLIGNDVGGLVASTDQGGPGAQIWLGPDATHCLVVGGCKPTTVLDQGTDDTLINVTPVTDPPAAAATPMNALKQLKQLKGMMRP